MRASAIARIGLKVRFSGRSRARLTDGVRKAAGQNVAVALPQIGIRTLRPILANWADVLPKRALKYDSAGKCMFEKASFGHPYRLRSAETADSGGVAISWKSCPIPLRWRKQTLWRRLLVRLWQTRPIRTRSYTWLKAHRAALRIDSRFGRS